MGREWGVQTASRRRHQGRRCLRLVAAAASGALLLAGAAAAAAEVASGLGSRAMRAPRGLGRTFLAPGAPRSPPQRPPTASTPAAAAAAAAVASVVGEPQAWAEEGIQGALNMLSTGSDGVYDPSTPEGAKALGLAFPVPTIEELEANPVTIWDVLPIVGLIGAAVGWGLFFVPRVMNRSDGARSVLFAEKEKVIEYTAEALELAATPIVKRLARPVDGGGGDEEAEGGAATKSIASSARKGKKKKKAGFSKRKS